MDHVLTFPNLDHVQRLQRAQNVVRFNPRAGRHFLNGNVRTTTTTIVVVVVVESSSRLHSGVVRIGGRSHRGWTRHGDSGGSRRRSSRRRSNIGRTRTPHHIAIVIPCRRRRRHHIMLIQQMKQDVFPITPVRHLSQIRQWLFGRPRLALAAGQLVRQRNDEFAVARLLVLRKGEDAGQIVPLARHFFLGKVPDNARAFFWLPRARARARARATMIAIELRHDVKVKGTRVEIQRLVIQKELGQEAEFLTVRRVLLAVDFVHGQSFRLVAINLAARRTKDPVGLQMPSVGVEFPHVGQSVFAHVQRFNARIGRRKGRVVPGFDLPWAHDNGFDIFHLGGFFVFLFKAGQCRIARHAVPIAARGGKHHGGGRGGSGGGGCCDCGCR